MITNDIDCYDVSDGFERGQHLDDGGPSRSNDIHFENRRLLISRSS